MVKSALISPPKRRSLGVALLVASTLLVLQQTPPIADAFSTSPIARTNDRTFQSGHFARILNARKDAPFSGLHYMQHPKHHQDGRTEPSVEVCVGDMLRTCRSILAGAMTAAALLYINPTIDTGVTPFSTAGPNHQYEQIRMFQPRAAQAADETATSLADASSSAFDDSLPSPDAVGTMSTPNDASDLSPLKLQQRSTALDEVWRLVDKYYIDRTFNGQDWDAVRDRYEERLNVKQLDDDATMKLATDMVKSLGDKYSRVLDKGGYARIQKFDLIGVGATLMPDSNKHLMVGAPPIAGSAADLAGLKVGDFIVAVNGVATEGRTAFDIIDQVSDDPNAKSITMTVRTQGPDDLWGEGLTRDVTMAREFAEVKDPITFKITERRKDGTNVGYIRISEFNSLVKPSLENAIKALEGQGANALVLDARSNPGGAFQSAVEIAGLFLDDTIATSVVDSNQVELPFKTTRGKVIVPKSDPVVMWLDGGSASATEVLAGALRDNCRVVTMGSKSFGKGLIQAVYGLKNGSGLVLTVAKYVTPNGTEIQGSGITPDVTGSAVPASFFPFGMSSDTSRVDFGDVKTKLSSPMCTAPE